MKLNPLNDRVAIEPVEQSNKTESGLLLPENAAEKLQIGKVVATGQGSYQHGSRVPLSVKVGDTVLFAKHSGTEVKWDGKKILLMKKILIMHESDILAVIASR